MKMESLAMKITFAPSKMAHENYKSFLMEYISQNNLKNICEVGGGSNPSLPMTFIKEHGLKYTLLDISQEELNKASNDFHKVKADIASNEIINMQLESNFDFIFSRMVAEHVADDGIFHQNIYHLLKEGGLAFHFIPTLWTLPYLVNLLIPESLAYKILLWIDPNRNEAGHFRKFPAYYKGCRGPTTSQIKKLTSYGYNIIEYIGFFGHGYYYEKFALLKWLHEKLASYLIQHPIALLTSYAYVVLQRPITIQQAES